MEDIPFHATNATQLPSISDSSTKSESQPNDHHLYKVVGMVMFIISLSLVIVRLILYILSSQGITFDKIPWISDLLFTVVVQIGVLFCFVFLFYKNKNRMTTKQILTFSNIRTINGKNILLTTLLGFCVVVASLGISFIWNLILTFLGYNSSSSADYMPTHFSVPLFILSFVLTAILPALCEEFAIRGGLLTVLKDKYNKKQLIIVMGLAFGLFHGFIVQFGYTAMMGALLAWIVLTTGSLVSGMIIHFINNGLAVIVSYGLNYGWFKGIFIGDITNYLTSNFGIVVLLYLVICGIGTLLIMAIHKSNKNNPLQMRPLHNDNLNAQYKPKITLSDNLFYIGAIVVTVLETIFTFIWGLY